MAFKSGILPQWVRDQRKGWNRLPIKHLIHCVIFVAWIYQCMIAMLSRREIHDGIDPSEDYGSFITWYSIFTRVCLIFVIPNMAFMTIGLLFCNVFPTPVRLRSSPNNLTSFICVRMVTRGLYPRLVRRNVKKHLDTMKVVGVENFIVEVVTDNSVNLAHFFVDSRHVREIVVPTTYTCKSGARNKARALQYCLEDGINTLNDDDYVIHLDEETVLTEDAVRGILNFVSVNKHAIGQGVITYGTQPSLAFSSCFVTLQNRLCTVADSMRVADDMGKHKTAFKLLNKPLFGMKGSFVITKFEAERKVTWEFGPEGSVCEDAWFALVAMEAGYTIDFVEGDMLERSPFTLSDFMKQRKRWMQGIYMVVFSNPSLKFKTKMCLMSAMLAWLCLPFCTSTILVQAFFPFNIPLYLDYLQTWLGASATYLYLIGYIRQFPIHRSSWLRIIFILPEILIASTVSVVLENIAVITMWFGNWYDFYIVQKEVESDSDVETDSANVKIPINATINQDVTVPMVHSSPTKPNLNNFTRKENSVINVVNEHENRNLHGVIQGV